MPKQKKHLTLKSATLGVIGFGNMMEALVAGALKKKAVKRSQILSVRHNPKRDDKLKKRYGISLVEDIPDIAWRSDVIFLGVKPQQMKDVLVLLQPYLKNQLVITVAAALPVRFYQKYLGKKLRLIRVMPNT